MAQPSRQLMNKFYEAAQKAKKDRDYMAGHVFDVAEDLVNAVHHGRPLQEWMPRVQAALASNAEGSINEEHTAWVTSQSILAEFAVEHGVTL